MSLKTVVYSSDKKTHFVKELKKRGLYSEELLEKIQENKGSVQNIAEIPDDIKKVFVVAGDITPEWHIKIQAALQKHVDSAISKTINFPNTATVDDVRKTYIAAFESGCRGITTYRDGSREKQIIDVKKKTTSYYDKLSGIKEDASAIVEAEPIESPRSELKKRPEVLNGQTHRIETPLGKAFVSINEDNDGNIFEVFINVGHAGSDIAADAEAMLSLKLLNSTKLIKLQRQLKPKSNQFKMKRFPYLTVLI